MGLGNFLGDVLGSKNPYVAHPADIGSQQFDYLGALLNQQGNQAQAFGNYQQGVGQNNAYIQALQQEMQGGPNSVSNQLAQAQLQQATNQNMAQQASALGSTRGINPALAARLIAEQGGNIQQQSAAQSAALQASTRANAQQQLGGAINQGLQSGLGMYGTTGNQAANYGQLQQGQTGQNLSNYWNAQGINSGVQAQNTETGNRITGQLINAASGAAAGAASGAGGAPPPTQGVGPVASGSQYGAMLKADGGPIPGKANKEGNSYANDTVPAMLSPGEIVLPRSITQGDDAAAKAKEFVEAIQKEHKPNDKIEYKHVLEHHKLMQEHLRKMACGGYA